MAKDKLREHFSNRQKSARQMLEKLMEAEPFAISDFEGIRGFLINLLTPYYWAERMGQSWVFVLESTYHDLLHAKLPHLIRKWVKEFGNEMDGDLTFPAFHKFALRVVRIDETVSSILESTSQSEDRSSRCLHSRQI
jgi:hypothetical protein